MCHSSIVINLVTQLVFFFFLNKNMHSSNSCFSIITIESSPQPLLGFKFFYNSHHGHHVDI